MWSISVALLAGLITLAGGLLVLKAQELRGPLFAFCAGALIATALLALVPDAIEIRQAENPDAGLQGLFAASLAGFFLFYVLENLQHGPEPTGEVLHHTHGHATGLWGALGIVVHGFVDGLTIGEAFSAGGRLGWTLALGVTLHKLADGISVAGVLRSTQHSHRLTLLLVLGAALAPLLGALVQPFVALPAGFLALLLSWFAGVFLYLGATSLLPAAHEASASRWLPAWAVGGLGFVALARLLGST
jgi:ZIP family zinc transporter